VGNPCFVNVPNRHVFDFTWDGLQPGMTFLCILNILSKGSHIHTPLPHVLIVGNEQIVAEPHSPHPLLNFLLLVHVGKDPDPPRPHWVLINLLLLLRWLGLDSRLHHFLTFLFLAFFLRLLCRQQLRVCVVFDFPQHDVRCGKQRGLW